MTRTRVAPVTEPGADAPPRLMSLRRSLFLNTASSALTPVVGLVSAPVMAQSLGVEGRGEFSAALAPALIVGSVAAFGLTDSLTYHIAKRPSLTRRALLMALAFVTALSVPAVAAVMWLAPTLAGGDPQLADLMRLAALLCYPLLFSSLVRGAAAGRQLWSAITAERVLGAVLRLVALLGLALTGHLTVISAVLLSSLLPLATVGVFWRVFRPVEAAGGPSDSTAPRGALTRSLMTFGGRTWVGSVATMLLTRINQLLLTPLASVEQLGILAVAITIADVPFVLTASVRDVLFGVSSATSDIDQLARVSRLTLLLTIVGSAVIAGTLPFWLAPLFGSGFEAAIPVTLLLLAAQTIGVPGMMMGAGAAALGHPGMRSAAQVVALVANVTGVVVLAPHLGALGVGIACVMDTLAVLLFSTYRLRSLSTVRPSHFFALRVEDAAFLFHQVKGLVRRRR